ncbi:MAG TPA: molecular chaperone TorD family protein [Acidimicrobiia bacterium]
MTYTASPVADRADLLRTLGVFCERPSPHIAALAETLGLNAPQAAEHTEVFLQQLPPYASIYLDPEGKIGGEARDRVAGFWRALRMTPPSEPDHLAALLGLWASILEAAGEEPKPERRRLLEHAARTLVWEHLASWLVPYLTRLGELSTGAYGDWAALVASVIEEALHGHARPEMPVHLMLPQEEPTGIDDLVAFLLAPVRSGIIITRADLSHAATTLGLGMRLGERAFSLSSLLAQARRPVLTWLAEEAERQRQLYAAGLPAAIAQAWSSRVGNTLEALRRITPQG